MGDLDKINAAVARAMKRIEHADSGCMIWHGATNSNGTALLGIGGRATMPVRRAFWLVHHGSLPNRLRCTCNTRTCVNIEHCRDAA
jgi:phosphoketolase